MSDNERLADLLSQVAAYLVSIHRRVLAAEELLQGYPALKERYDKALAGQPNPVDTLVAVEEFRKTLSGGSGKKR
jgi:hypothetical protein